MGYTVIAEGEPSQKLQQNKERKGKNRKEKLPVLHSKMLAGAQERMPTQGGTEVDFKDSLSSQYLELEDESKQVGQG